MVPLVVVLVGSSDASAASSIVSVVGKETFCSSNNAGVGYIYSNATALAVLIVLTLTDAVVAATTVLSIRVSFGLVVS